MTCRWNSRMRTNLGFSGVVCDNGVVVSPKDAFAIVRCPGWIAS